LATVNPSCSCPWCGALVTLPTPLLGGTSSGVCPVCGQTVTVLGIPSAAGEASLYEPDPIHILRVGALIGTRRGINFIPTAPLTIVGLDDAVNDKVDITIDAVGPFPPGPHFHPIYLLRDLSLEPAPTLTLKNAEAAAFAILDAIGALLTFDTTIGARTITTNADTTYFNDAHGQQILELNHTDTAVNYMGISNAIAGGAPSLFATGASASVSLCMVMKGVSPELRVMRDAGVGDSVVLTLYSGVAEWFRMQYIDLSTHFRLNTQAVDGFAFYVLAANVLNLHSTGAEVNGTLDVTGQTTVGTPAIGANELIHATFGVNLSPVMDAGHWTGGADWTFLGGFATHTATGANPLFPTVAIVPVIGSTYRVVFTLSNWTAGSITVTLGGVVGVIQAFDGTYTSFITAYTADNLIFTPTATFAGKISVSTVQVITEGTLTVDKDILMTDARGNAVTLAAFCAHVAELKNNCILDRSFSYLTCAGGVLTYTLYAVGGEMAIDLGGITYPMAAATYSVALVGGTDANPVTNYIYFVLGVGNIPLLTVSAVYPTNLNFVSVDTFVVGAVAGVNYTIYSYLRARDESTTFVNRVIDRMEEGGTLYVSGYVPTVTAIALSIAAAGSFYEGIYQMISNNAVSAAGGFYWIDSAGAFQYSTLLSDLNEYANGVALAGADRQNIVWGIIPTTPPDVSLTPTVVKLFAVLQSEPPADYTNDAEARADAYDCTNYYPPHTELRKAFVPIARTIVLPSTPEFRTFATGLYWKDIRGKITAGGGAATPVDLSGVVPYLGATGAVNIGAWGFSCGTIGMSGQLTNTLAFGTPPFVITSSTVNANLNADMLDGNHAAAFAIAIHNASHVTGGGDIIATATIAAVGLCPILSNVATQFLNGIGGWTVPAGTGLFNVVEDLTPQLGGDLDLNGKNLTVPVTNISSIGAAALALASIFTRILSSDNAQSLSLQGAGTTGIDIAAGGAAGVHVGLTIDNNVHLNWKNAAAVIKSAIFAAADILTFNNADFWTYVFRLLDHSATAMVFKEGANVYLTFDTTNGSEKIAIGKAVTTISQITSTLAIGTKPLAVTSTTMCDNLNVDLLDGYHAAAFLLLTGGTMSGPIAMGGQVISGGARFDFTLPMCLLEKDAAQAIGSGAWTAITFGAGDEISDLLGWHDPGGFTTRITPTKAGYYLVMAQITWGATTGELGGHLLFDGTVPNGYRGRCWSAAPTSQGQSTCIDVVYFDGVNDYVELLAYHSSGGFVNATSNRLWCIRLMTGGATA